jgi:tRNA U34 2-thiouridine synthase MnmA/TrmU
MWANVAPGVGERVLVQCSAHGAAIAATIENLAPLVLRFDEAQRRIAPGQSVVCYDVTNSHVLGGGIAEAVNPAGN